MEKTEQNNKKGAKNLKDKATKSKLFDQADQSEEPTTEGEDPKNTPYHDLQGQENVGTGLEIPGGGPFPGIT